MSQLRIMAIAVLLAMMAGCSFWRMPLPSADYYYLNPSKKLTDVGRVVLVHLNNDSRYPEISADVTRALFEELQKRQIFSIVVVRQDDPVWRSLQLDMGTDYTARQLRLAGRALRCDAILSGTITEYAPYPHMTVGLSLKMVSCRDGQLIWAFEQVWDASDRKTEYRMKKYLAEHSHSDLGALAEQLVTVSTIRFMKFVAYEVAATL